MEGFKDNPCGMTVYQTISILGLPSIADWQRLRLHRSRALSPLPETLCRVQSELQVCDGTLQWAYVTLPVLTACTAGPLLAQLPKVSDGSVIMFVIS